MEKQRKPLSTKKPPIPSEDHSIIEDWIVNDTMPKMQVLVGNIDEMIRAEIPELQYSIKWGNAFYGTAEQGWLIEVAAFAVSVNIVFLSGAHFDTQPPLGSDDRSRYIKLRTMEELNDPLIIGFIREAKRIAGWK